MDIFEGRYFNINRKILTFIGQWPYATNRKIIIRLCFMSAMIILPLPQFISAAIHHDDIDRFMFNVFSCLTAIVAYLKLVGLTIAEDKMKDLFENIRNNWLMISDKNEREILVKYSERARNFTIFYAISMFTIGTLTTLPPISHEILDAIIPLDNPRQPIYILDGEFFVDRESHLVLLFFWDYFTIMSVTVTAVAVDTMYITVVEHCCAMNAIISYRLKDLGKTSPDNIPETNNNDSYKKIIQIINLHQKILSFTSLLNTSYSLNFLFVLAVNLLIIPLNAVAIIANVGRDFIHFFPYAAVFCAITLHLFCVFWPGQRIIDHNISLYIDAYSNQWYVTALRVRKILLIFMTKCYYPASLNAGGLFQMNMEVFFRVMKTAISYITVLSSYR